MSDISGDLDLADPGAYAHWCDHVIRFADLDAVGHVNNLAFGQFFESGRVALFADAGIAVDDPGLTTMIVRMTAEYRAQMSFPGAVRVGTRALRLGRSSCTLGQGLFQGDACTATSEAVVVVVDLANGRPTPIPDLVRARIDALSRA